MSQPLVRLLWAGLWAVILSIAAIGNALASEAVSKPNVLFIFSDDQTYAAIHALGCDEIETPTLDRLARQGTTFTHAYNMGAWHGAVCVASRTMLNTGRFLWHARESEKQLGEDVRQGKFWAQRMRAAGYDTYFTGKWHVKAKVEDVFQRQRVHHVRPGMPNQTNVGYDRPREDRPDVWSPWDKSRGGYWDGGRHWSEVVADDAEAYLKEASMSDSPFFMYVAFNAPHDPRQSPKEYVDKYPLSRVAVPKSFLPKYPFAEAMGCGQELRDERLAPFPRTKHAVQVHRQEYYAIITHMDAQIGRILDALDKSGLAENTVVIFTSDHGLAVGNHGLLGKQNMYDHSVRVPLVIAGPNIQKDRRLDTPVYLQDTMPTSLEIAGVDHVEEIEFHSLLPLIEGKKETPYPAIYGAYRNLQRMVTQDGFKLIVYPTSQKVLLFNLQADPEEMHDLSKNPEYADRLRSLSKELCSLQQAMDDPIRLVIIQE